jgi:nitrogen fixation/metabolism regulation signal transduction histidine kinase
MRQFVADASHELRTPLAAVRGYAELYRQGAVRDPADVASAMTRIEGEATRMGGLVEDLLMLARLDDQRPMRIAPVDLTVLAADAAQDARAIDPTRQITISGLSGPLGPTMVPGDDAKLRQLLANLVSNALNHTPHGSPIEVAVGTRESDQHVVLEVRDHGPGVDPEKARKVFERFYRADPSRARGSGGGNGLGLAIAAAIINAHHGRIGVAQQALITIVRQQENRLPSGYAVIFYPSDGSNPVELDPTSESTTPDMPSVLPITSPHVRSNEAFYIGSESGDLKWRAIAGRTRDFEATFIVAVPLTTVDTTVRKLVLVELLIGLAVLAACAVMGWYAVHRAFRPLRQIEDTAAAIAAGDRGRRIPTRTAKDEVTSLSR